MLARILILALAALVAGCSLAPVYERPDAPVPAQWPQGAAYAKPPATPSTDKAAADLPWRDFIHDERLQKVVAMALDESRPLRKAVAAVEEARAQYTVQAAGLWPTVNAGVGGSAGRSLTNNGGANQSSTYRSYSATLGISAYELDLFGKVRSLTNAAFETWLASDEGRRSVRITLIADTANAWLALAADQSHLNVARETMASTERSLTIVRKRLELGVSTGADVADADVVYQQARSDVASYTTAVAQDRNALELLVGAPVPDALLPDGLPSADGWLAPVPAGLSSTALLERPDVRQAERQLKAANADIGAARAAFFPSISLTTSAGLGSVALSSLFSGGAFVWAFVPTISVPIFDAGVNQGNLEYAQAAQKSAVANYELVIQTAFTEVANALAVRGTIDERVSAQVALVASSNKSFTLAQARFDRGVDTYLNALISQRVWYNSQQTLVTAQYTELANQVTLYRALGGGIADDQGTAGD